MIFVLLRTVCRREAVVTRDKILRDGREEAVATAYRFDVLLFPPSRAYSTREAAQAAPSPFQILCSRCEACKEVCAASAALRFMMREVMHVERARRLMRCVPMRPTVCCACSFAPRFRRAMVTRGAVALFMPYAFVRTVYVYASPCCAACALPQECYLTRHVDEAYRAPLPARCLRLMPHLYFY